MVCGVRKRSLAGEVVLAAMLLCGGCQSTPSAAAYHIEGSDLHEMQGSIDGYQEWHETIDLGHGVAESARIEVTSKGNGSLAICGQSFRVYDGHDNGSLFEPTMAHITFVDLDDDGYRDLVLTGLLVDTGEKGLLNLATPFVWTYRYDDGTCRFVPMVPVPDIGMPDELPVYDQTNTPQR